MQSSVTSDSSVQQIEASSMNDSEGESVNLSLYKHSFIH